MPLSTPDEILATLRRSTFRRQFRLDDRDTSYLARHGLSAVLMHTRTFIDQRLSSALPTNDGQQTPMRGHPAFVAQHATATCCRGCVAKWHQFPIGRALTT